MENITLTTKRENQFDFDLTASGIDIKKAAVHFCVSIDKHTSSLVHCRHLAGQKWSVTFPKGLLDSGKYQFKLCVVVDDFYFEPASGNINVVTADNITVGSSPKVSSEDEEVATKPKEEKPKEEKPKEENKPVTAKDQKPKDEKKLVTAKEEKPKEEKPKKEGFELSLPAFQFLSSDHPWKSMPDGGEKDRKVRDIIRSLK